MGCIWYSRNRCNVTSVRRPLRILRTGTKLTSSVPTISAGRISSLSHPPPKGYMSTACWTIAEIGVGVIAASLATIRHLRDRNVRTLLSTNLSGKNRDSVSEGILRSRTRQTPHQRLGSEVDLVSQSQPAAGGSRDGIFKLFSKKQSARESNAGIHDPNVDLTGNEGVTNTIIESFRRGKKEVPVAAGAADFLGEFGIMVERTWEVQEIRME